MAVDASGSRQEPGCHTFDLLKDDSDPQKFYFYEGGLIITNLKYIFVLEALALLTTYEKKWKSNFVVVWILLRICCHSPPLLTTLRLNACTHLMTVSRTLLTYGLISVQRRGCSSLSSRNSSLQSVGEFQGRRRRDFAGSNQSKCHWLYVLASNWTATIRSSFLLPYLLMGLAASFISDWKLSYY